MQKFLQTQQSFEFLIFTIDFFLVFLVNTTLSLFSYLKWKTLLNNFLFYFAYISLNKAPLYTHEHMYTYVYIYFYFIFLIYIKFKITLHPLFLFLTLLFSLNAPSIDQRLINRFFVFVYLLVFLFLLLSFVLFFFYFTIFVLFVLL